jgi:hypothetical protein
MVAVAVEATAALALMARQPQVAMVALASLIHSVRVPLSVTAAVGAAVLIVLRNLLEPLLTEVGVEGPPLRGPLEP